MVSLNAEIFKDVVVQVDVVDVNFILDYSVIIVLKKNNFPLLSG